MPIEFRNVSVAPLQQFSGVVPRGALIGVVGSAHSGAGSLTALAAGRLQPTSGSVTASDPRQLIGPMDELTLLTSPVQTLGLDHALALRDEVSRRQALLQIHRLRREGASILWHSHNLDLLRQHADEIWWMEDGRLRERGDPGDVLGRFQTAQAQRFQEWAAAQPASPVQPSLRRGDGRAEIVSLETLSPAGQPTLVWQSGETVQIRVVVRFRAAVQNPVIGIMIRTRIGMEVYGTNTELEQVNLAAQSPGDTQQVTFTFPCNLCPQEYTLTAASHDPDGTWHDWLEDAVAFAVADTRYTAGVANLRAVVRAEKR